MPWEQSSDYIRSGHRSPDEFKPHSLRTVWISPDEGIKAIVGKPKTGHGMEIVTFLFEVKKGWTVEKAKEWFERHKEYKSFNLGREHFCFVAPILEKIVGKPLLIRGVALSAGLSRNFNIYLEEELQKFATKLAGAPVYLEHVTALNAVGRVAAASWSPSSKAVFYEAEIYDDETQEKIKHGLIQHVSVAADYEKLDVVDGQIPYGLHNAELSLVAVPGMPQTNIQVVDDQTFSGDRQKALGEMDEAVDGLRERQRVLEEKRTVNRRAVVAPEAAEQAKETMIDLSKMPLRDVMRRLS